MVDCNRSIGAFIFGIFGVSSTFVASNPNNQFDATKEKEVVAIGAALLLAEAY